ncbi:MAG: hypothetical protein HOV94_12590 [Saccharothrix sp.]|nr:hypothetical protein [Saccharothrix sp.]
MNPVAIAFALLVMVSFAAIPRRWWHVQLPAVLGWALVWADNAVTGHWTDVAGLLVTALSLVWAARLRRKQPPPGSSAAG